MHTPRSHALATAGSSRRRSRRSSLRWLAASLLASGLGLTAPAQAGYTPGTVYDVIPLLTYSGGGTTTEAWSINNAGQIVGQAQKTGDPNYNFDPTKPILQATYWQYSGFPGNTSVDPIVATNLGTVSGGVGSQAFAINNSGTVAGTSDYNGEDGFTAFSGPYNGTLTDRGNQGGSGLFSGAQGINDAGIVVGFSDTTDGNNSVAAYWLPGGGAQQLTAQGALVPNSNSIAYAINNAGASTQIVGSSDTGNGNFQQAFVADLSGNMTALPFISGGSDAIAYAINTAGQIAGVSNDVTGTYRATVWRFQSGNWVGTMLGQIGGRDSYGLGINTEGDIVGSSFTASQRKEATIWDNATYTPVNLNGLMTSGTSAGWYLAEARSVNDLGQIVGYGFLNGVKTAFLLNPRSLPPVPEPSTIITLATAALPLGITAYRRRRNAPNSNQA